MHDDAPTPVVTVRTADGLTSRFSRAFHVGRSAECEVRVDDDLVSRKHLLVSVTDGRWGFSDLQSSNGVFVNGTRVTTGPLGEGLTLRLGGDDGPTLTFRIERPVAATMVRRPAEGAPPPAGSETMVVANYADR